MGPGSVDCLALHMKGLFVAGQVRCRGCVMDKAKSFFFFQSSFLNNNYDNKDRVMKGAAPQDPTKSAKVAASI